MLTLKERRRVLTYLRFFTTFYLLPVTVHLHTVEPRVVTGTSRNTWICRVSYAIFLAHTLYKVLSLVYALFFSQGILLHQIMVHGVVAAAAVM